MRDRRPDEAKKYKQEAILHTETTETDPQLYRIFCSEVERVISTLRDAAASGDIDEFTITAHGIKSALANIGEQEAANQALGLENAGNNGDKAYIKAHTENFLKLLESLAEKYAPTETPEDSSGVEDDTSYLREQLEIVKTACEGYDDDMAYAILDGLREKSWSKNTSVVIDQIRDMLYVYSDFEGAAESIKKHLQQ